MRPRSSPSAPAGRAVPAGPPRRRGKARIRVILPLSALALFLLVIPFHRSGFPSRFGSDRALRDGARASGLPMTTRTEGMLVEPEAPGSGTAEEGAVIRTGRDFRPGEGGGLWTRGLGETSFVWARALREPGGLSR